MAGSAPSGLANALGLGGLLPFVAGAVWLLVGPADPAAPSLAARVLVAYAATIVAFLGGIHWGLAFTHPGGPPPARLSWGVVPSLVAWPALLLPSATGLALLAGMLVLCYAVDHRAYPQLGLAAWLPLRRRLSVVAALSCAAGALALAR
jgi:hypothetical protein